MLRLEQDRVCAQTTAAAAARVTVLLDLPGICCPNQYLPVHDLLNAN